MRNTRTGKKLVSWLMALVMVLGMVPAMTVTAAATTTRTTALNLMDYDEDSNPDGYDAEHPISGAVLNGDVYSNAAEGWSWNHATKTLTLDGANINEAGSGCALMLPDGATIQLTGSNTITAGSANTTGSYGVACRGALRIDGTGSLSVESGDVSQEKRSTYSYGILCSSLEINGTVSVVTTGGTSHSDEDGALSAGVGNFSSNNATVTVNGGTLVATGGTATSGLPNHLAAVSCGIYGALSANGGDTTAVCGSASTAEGYGVARAVYKGLSTATGATIKAGASADSNPMHDNYSEQGYLNVSYEPAIAVGAQTGTVVAGIGGSATYTATPTNFTHEVVCTVEWVSAAHTDVDAAVSGNTVTLTAAATAAVGTYTFKLTTGAGDDKVVSDEVSFVVAAKQPRTTPLDLTGSSVSYFGNDAGVNPGTADIDAFAEGWSWNHATKTLTLDGANIDCSALTSGGSSALELPDGATIVLTAGSVNYAIPRDGSDEGVDAMGTLSVTGTGTLHIGAENTAEPNNGIYALGNLSIEDSTLVIYAQDSALATDNEITVDHAVMNLYATEDYSNIWAEAGIEITDSTINTYGGYDGIGADVGITIDGSTISCLPRVGYETTYGIAIEEDCEGDIVITNSTVTARSGNSNVNDIYGIYNYDGDITVTGSTVTAESGNATGSGDYSFGIYTAEGDISFANSTVTATAGSAVVDSMGIISDDGDITVTGSTVTAQSGNATGSDSYSLGIYTVEGNISFANSNVTVTTGSCAVNSIGIVSDSGNITVTGGTVHATAGSAGGNSIGISAAEGNLVVNSGTVTGVGAASTATAAYTGSFGLYAGSSMEILGGSASGSASADAALSVGALSVGTIKVTGGTLTGTGSTVSMAAGSFDYNTSKMAITAPKGAVVGNNATVGMQVIYTNATPPALALSATISKKPASNNHYVPSTRVVADSATLNSAALAVGRAINGGTAKLVPLSGYTAADISRMQANSQLELATSYSSGYSETADDAAALRKAIGTAAANGTSPMFVNIKLYLRDSLTGAMVAEVTATDKTVTFTVELDAALQQAAKNGAKIVVLRVHDGKVSALTAALNADKTEASFATSLYSSYAVVATTGQLTSAQTGDAFSPMLWAGLVVMSVLGLGYVGYRKRTKA